jgi:hypothetical protein
MPANLVKGKHFRLSEIIDLLKKKKFEYNTEYQRSGLIWPKYKQEKLIDSIIKDLSIGLLFLKKQGKKYEVLDGQQRLKTIHKFIKGNLKTSPEFTPEFADKNFKDLKKDIRRYSIFNAFKVYYTLADGTDQEISDIFLRLQEGLPLNTPEKLNAILGKMRDFVVGVSKQSLFQNVSVSSHRFSHRHIAAQAVLLELDSDFERQRFPDLRLKDLSQMYGKHKLRLPRGLHRRTYGAINLLHRSLKKDAKVIRKKSDLPLVYVLASYLRKRYVIKNFRPAFKNFIVLFFTELEQTNIGEEEENEYVKYKKLRTRGLTGESFRERFEILLGMFLDRVRDVQPKDKKRGFDFGQKLAIYYQKDKGICQFCNKEVEWEDASFHHKKFHSKGGPTTVANGQLVHRKCHEDLHKKIGPDTDGY